MQLVRLVVVTFSREVVEPATLPVHGDDFTVEGLIPTADRTKFLVPCTIRLQYQPKITAERAVVVPEKQRKRAEEAIEAYANLQSVCRSIGRKLSSPSPCVGFIADDDADKQMLKSSVAIHRKEWNTATPSSPQAIDLSSQIIHLQDRLDGVALLAEALDHEHSSGQFRELVRVFERAFAVGGRALSEPLALFLAGTPFNYRPEEIQNWAVLRDGVTHADASRVPLLEGDVAWPLKRVLQAAYDVLLNKKHWRANDAARRSIWTPTSGTTSTEGDVFMTQGAYGEVHFTVFDEFKRYPLLAGAQPSDASGSVWFGPTPAR